MAKKNPWIKYIVILAVALILLLVVSLKNRRYEQKVSDVFKVNVEDINGFTVAKGEQSVTLVRGDTSWVFAEPDTGDVRENRIERFFENVVNAKKTGYITKNPEKYDQYRVSDSLGTRIDLLKGEYNLASLYVGRSQTTWSQDYIRYPDDPKVYLSQKKILSHVSERPSFWR